MVRLVDTKCSVCDAKMMIGDKREIEMVLKGQKPVCGHCQIRQCEARIASYKAKVAKYPKDIRVAVEVGAIRQLVIKMVGEEVYWQTVAGMIEE